MSKNGPLKEALFTFAGGQLDNVIAVRVPFVRLTGCLEGAILLSQMMYWTDRTKLEIDGIPGWVAKSDKDWADEIFLKRHALAKAVKALEDLEILERKKAQFAGAPRWHYRLKVDSFLDVWAAFCETDSLKTTNRPAETDLDETADRLVENDKSTCRKQQIDLDETTDRLAENDESIIETNPETTPENTLETTIETCLASPGDVQDPDLSLFDNVALVDGQVQPLPTLHARHWALPGPLCRISHQEGHAITDSAMVTCEACQELIQAGPPRDDQLLFEALAYVAQWDLEAMTVGMRGVLNQTAGKFRKMKNQTVGPADILAFADWFRDHHYHGQDPPRPDQIRKEWGRFRNWQANQGAHLKAALDSQADRAATVAEAQAEDPNLKLARTTWREACMQLEHSMPRSTYAHYIAPLTVLTPNGVFRLQAPTEEIQQWITGRLQQKIASALEAVVGRKVELEVVAP